MQQTEQSLNLQDMYKRVIITALNKHKKVPQAAKAMGVSERVVYLWIRRFDIKRDVGDYWYIETKVMA